MYCSTGCLALSFVVSVCVPCATLVYVRLAIAMKEAKRNMGRKKEHEGEGERQRDREREFSKSFRGSKFLPGSQ